MLIRIFLATAVAVLGVFGSGRTARAADPVVVVAYGDSITFLGGYLREYDLHIRRDLKIATTIVNRGYPGWTSADLLQHVREDPYYRDALAGADVVILEIGFNDFYAARSQYLSGSCGGIDGQDCLRTMLAEFEANWDALVGEIAGAVDAEHTAVRLLDIYYPSTGYDQQAAEVGAAAFDALNWYVTAMNAHIAASAQAYGVGHAAVHEAFNGPDGSEDPTEKGYVLSDGVHPSATGNVAIADALRATGYAPLETTCADVNGDTVVNAMDLGRIASRYGGSAEGADSALDVNADRRINVFDMVISAAQFSRRCSQRA